MQQKADQVGEALIVTMAVVTTQGVFTHDMRPEGARESPEASLPLFTGFAALSKQGQHNDAVVLVLDR